MVLRMTLSTRFDKIKNKKKLNAKIQINEKIMLTIESIELSNNQPTNQLHV